MDMKQHYRLGREPPSQEALVMTELAENPQDSFDPCLDAPVFGAVNLGGDTDSTAARLAAMAVFASGGALRLPRDHWPGGSDD